MADKTLSAGPEAPEPIVTPKPKFWTQYDSPWGAEYMRPGETHGDTWAASGCHPTSTSMVVEWYRQHPTLGPGLALPHGPGDSTVNASPQYIWKWIHDPDGTPGTDRPPYTPYTGSGKNMKVDHAGVWNAPKAVTANGTALKLKFGGSWKGRKAGQDADLDLRAKKKDWLKRALHECGPLAINMTFPAHYVLLWGYRGNYLFILDCGNVLKKWAATHPDWPKGQSPKNFALTDSTTGQVVARFYKSSCDVMIDGEYEFQSIKLGNTTGPMAFLDTIINGHGYCVPGAGPFAEFLSEVGPEGAPAPGTPPPSVPTPPKPPSANPSPPAGASPVNPSPPAGDPGSSNPSGGPPASDPSAGTTFFEQLWDYLLGLGQAPTANSGVTVVLAVTDDGGQPVGDAEVELKGLDGSRLQTGKTDDKGKWASGKFDPGSYYVVARKGGYEESAVLADLESSSEFPLCLKQLAQPALTPIPSPAPSPAPPPDPSPPNPDAEQTLAWGAKVSPAFRKKVVEICGRIKANPDDLMSCMAFESCETFSPSIKNKASGATGLIQFMKKTAQNLGTTTDALAAMTAEDQLDYVEKYFASFKKPGFSSISDLYMAILWPKAIGKSDDYVLFSEDDGKVYKQNAGLDANKDGQITKAEAAACPRAKLTKGKKNGYYG